MAIGEEHTQVGEAPGEQQGPERRRWRRLARLRARARQNALLHQTWRLVVLIAGFAVVLAGVVMLITPGPGWVAIFVGLAILATEFAWAERLLGRAKVMARRAAERALDPRRRRRNIWLTVAALVLAVLLSAWYVAMYGWPAVVQSAWERVLSWF